jgi:hypothetical protein
MSEGTLSHLNDVIFEQNGEMYVVYCIIRFKKDACGPEGYVFSPDTLTMTFEKELNHTKFRI